MPYQQLPNYPVKIRIPNLSINNTTIYREATATEMKYSFENERVILTWLVQHFSVLDNDEKGEYLGDFISDYRKTTTATNNDLCDISNGYPLTEEQILEDKITYTGQFSFFQTLAETQPILVNELIRNFGLLIEDWKKI